MSSTNLRSILIFASCVLPLVFSEFFNESKPRQILVEVLAVSYVAMDIQPAMNHDDYINALGDMKSITPCSKKYLVDNRSHYSSSSSNDVFHRFSIMTLQS